MSTHSLQQSAETEPATGRPATVPTQAGPAGDAPTGHMVVFGDDALAHRLAVELATLYGQRVTVVLPSLRRGHGPHIAALAADEGVSVTAVEAEQPDEATLRAVGVGEAAALALTSDDDQANIQAGLRARRINPGLRLVLRVYNRRLGGRIEQLLDRAAATHHPGLSPAALQASTTVLSASATAAPALVAAAVAGRGHVVHVDGRLLRLSVVSPAAPARGQEVATLAVTPGGAHPEPEGALLPDPESVAQESERVVLELLGRTQPPARTRRLPGLSALPFSTLFSPRLRWALTGLAALVIVFAALTWALTGQSPTRAAWLTTLDVLGIADPADEAGPGRKVLQILTSVSGMLLMPLLIALALEALGAFRTVSALRRPPRGLSGHIVLVGLGRVGSRVLERLWELEVPVVCVEAEPTALGIARARSYGVPVVLGDATQEGVLEAAKVHRASALMTLTSDDGTNLEAALYGRECNPELRVVLRLFDDDFAGDIYQALRDSYPRAATRSRSVSFLAAPSFASAMMGRQVIGALAVGRQVVLVAAVQVSGNPYLSGRTVAEAQRPGHWRVLAVDLVDPPERTPDLANPYLATPELLWTPVETRMLVDGDLVVVAATREGLGLLLRPDTTTP
ncbi:NAD-binding protein [Kitasatospora sp. NPDC050463]|uniref:NAD-binding protein n=1 Tax=Kitasatospora sp. NPDC050463 TaxID=3155786 RepID=UPI0033F7D493